MAQTEVLFENPDEIAVELFLNACAQLRTRDALDSAKQILRNYQIQLDYANPKNRIENITLHLIDRVKDESFRYITSHAWITADVDQIVMKTLVMASRKVANSNENGRNMFNTYVR